MLAEMYPCFCGVNSWIYRHRFLLILLSIETCASTNFSVLLRHLHANLAVDCLCPIVCSNFDIFEFARLRLCPGISCLQSYRRHIIKPTKLHSMWNTLPVHLDDLLPTPNCSISFFLSAEYYDYRNVFALLQSQFLDSSPQSRTCGYIMELFLCPRIRNFEALCLVIFFSSSCHTRSTQFHSM